MDTSRLKRPVFLCKDGKDETTADRHFWEIVLSCKARELDIARGNSKFGAMPL